MRVIPILLLCALFILRTEGDVSCGVETRCACGAPCLNATGCGAPGGGCCFWWFDSTSGEGVCSNTPPPLEHPGVGVGVGGLAKVCRCELDPELTHCTACNSSVPSQACQACAPGYTLLSSSLVCCKTDSSSYDDDFDIAVVAIVVPLILLLLCASMMTYAFRQQDRSGEDEGQDGLIGPSGGVSKGGLQGPSYTAVYGAVLASQEESRPQYQRKRNTSDYAHYSQYIQP